MSNTKKLLLIHLFAHALIIPAFLYGEVWMFVASFLWWQWIAATAISAGYHRYFSHKAFRTGKWYDYYFQIIGLFANPGPALTWAGAHRMHHAYSDTEKDPHSPKYKGWFKVYTSQWGDDAYIERRMMKGLYNPISKFFYKNYYKLIIALVVVLFLIDPLLMIFGWALTVVQAFHGYGLINCVTHLTGKAKNNAIANILTSGEGWHKNHHDKSNDWRIGKKWWQIDPGAVWIRAIKI